MILISDDIMLMVEVLWSVDQPEHERHWSGSGPEQVAQEVWQARHSAELVDKKNLGKELSSQALKHLT